MRIAIPYEDENVYQHYGKTNQFIIYEVRQRSIIKSWVVDCCGTGKSSNLCLLQSRSIDLVICQDICSIAKEELESFGISVIDGAYGLTDKVVDDYLHGCLETLSQEKKECFCH